MDVATIKGVIDRLTGRGLTETSQDPEDGRRLLVSLTRAGQQLAEKVPPNALAITRETLAPLDAKERDMLMALLNKLRGFRVCKVGKGAKRRAHHLCHLRSYGGHASALPTQRLCVGRPYFPTI